jgi:hypothetical protein
MEAQMARIYTQNSEIEAELARHPVLRLMPSPEPR